MTWTKERGSYDRVDIDGSDVSNAFRTFSAQDEYGQDPVTGFSATGTEETLLGTRVQGFEGEAYYTKELYAILKPLYDAQAEFEVEWQPNGLRDSTREVYYGTCRLVNFNPNGEVGGVRVMTVTLKASTSAGIVTAAGT